MVISEEFLRHAAECTLMAKTAPDRESRLAWHRMAERWARCAELARRQDSCRSERKRTSKLSKHSKHGSVWAH
jgi:hypothetical protein